jgi:DNA-binding XRE family transcriptional regulator
MTQSSLASSCDIDVRTIQMIEKGTMNMSLKIFFAIAKFFEMNPSEFLLRIEDTI